MIPRLNDLFEKENEIYFQQDWAPSHFHDNVRNFLDRTFNQRWMGRRGSATVFSPQSPDLNPSRFLHLGNFKEHGVRYKTTNTGLTERLDWTCHQWYSISNNPDGISLCSTSLLGLYCGRRWTFWKVRDMGGSAGELSEELVT